jgi:molybdopterin-guanine dinucleotide biosynthesis protein A
VKIAVVILAGGEGRRIGGDKPLRLLGGRRLIDRAEELTRQWSEILAVSVRYAGQVGRTDLACITDEPGIDGPLGGLVAALRFARLSGCRAVLTIPADMPFLPGDLKKRLSEALGDAGASLASSGGHLHPVCGLWSARALDSVPDYLASGRRSLKGFAETVRYSSVEWPSEPSDPFSNINSAEDLAAAERLLQA